MMLSRRLLRGGFKFRRPASTKHAGIFAVVLGGGYAGATSLLTLCGARWTLRGAIIVAEQ